MRFPALIAIVATVATVACTVAPQAPKLDSSRLVSALQSSASNVADVTVLTADSDPNHLLGRPNQYVGKIDFRDTRLDAGGGVGIGNGGTVEIFDTAEDRKRREDYIRELAKTPIFSEYTYASPSGMALLRLSHSLTPDQAEQYRAWFAAF